MRSNGKVIDLVMALTELKPFFDKIGAKVQTDDWKYEDFDFHKIIITWRTKTDVEKAVS